MLTPEAAKEIFVTGSGLLTEEEFTHALEAAQKTNHSLEHHILTEYFVSEEYFISLLGEYYGVPGTTLPTHEVDPEALHLVSREYARSRQVIPFALDDTTVKIAVLDPTDQDTIHALGTSSAKQVEVYVTTKEALERALMLFSDKVTELLAGSGDSNIEEQDVGQLLDNLVEAAVLGGASDIHIEPYEVSTLIRLRVDGALKTIARLPTASHEQLISRVKVVASLKVDEKRVPQDGRFSTSVGDQSVDVRVSIVPSVWGEKVVMRVLVKGSMHFNLAHLGFAEEDLETIERHLKSSHGMILLCGPTGSGKTTTLYSCIRSIASDRIDVANISTVEDPIEYTVSRVTQIQIKPAIDLTFANGLRSLLRQDPDILMVGEIRDNETAEIATRAALVGRLLLSSVHAHDAVSVIPRMQSMGADPYLLADTLRLIISQRLVRRLCLHCRKSTSLTDDNRERLYKFYNLQEALDVLHAHGDVTDQTRDGEDIRFYTSSGCEFCHQSGYVGRVAVYELLEIDDALRDHIANRHNLNTIRQSLKTRGQKTMFTNGLLKALNGVVDIEDVIRSAV